MGFCLFVCFNGDWMKYHAKLLPGDCEMPSFAKGLFFSGKKRNVMNSTFCHDV